MKKPSRRGMLSRIVLMIGTTIPSVEATPVRLQAEVTRLHGEHC